MPCSSAQKAKVLCELESALNLKWLSLQMLKGSV